MERRWPFTSLLPYIDNPFMKNYGIRPYFKPQLLKKRDNPTSDTQMAWKISIIVLIHS